MFKIFTNLKVGKKLQISFGSVIAIFLITILVAIVCITNINDKMKDFYSRPYVNAVLQMEIRKDVQYTSKQILLAITESQGDNSKMLAAVDESITKIDGNVEKIGNTFANKDLLNKVKESITLWKEQINEVLELLATNNAAGALVLYNEVLEESTLNAQNFLTEVGTFADGVAASAYSSAVQLGNIAIIIMIAIGIVSVLFCIYIGMIITKSIKTPVLELETAAKKLRAGELDAEIKYISKDEMGSLADNFREAFSFIQAVIGDTSYMLGEISQGNFCVDSKKKEQYIGEFVHILTSMNTLTSNLDGTIKQIVESTEQVALGSNQMAESAQSLAEGASEQAGAIEELTATIEDVSSSVVTSAQQAETAYQQSREYEKEAEYSSEEMDKLNEAMERITETSKQIEQIIGEIEDIASQTNLLSLNASIEAARAGEAGKGFAVVADQIGKLASDSAKSAINTRQLIGKSLEEIRLGSNVTVNTSQSLLKVIEGIKHLAESTKETSDVSLSQSEKMKQVQLGIEQISSVVQNNSSAAEETSATSEELSAQADSLRGLVSKFTISQ